MGDSRREFLGKAGGVAAAATLGPVALSDALAEAKKKERGRRVPHPKNPQEALELLVKGNRRAQAADIASRGPIVKPAIDAGQIAVVAAVYEIKTGKVSLI